MDDLAAIERDRLRSLVERDMERAAELHADDFQLITPSGRVLSKEQYLGDVASGALAYTHWEAGDIEVRSYGDAAVLRYPSELEVGTRGGRPNRGRYRHTDLYERRDGRWQVVWSQATWIEQGTSLSRDDIRSLLDRAAAGWADGDAAAVADCFAADVEYLDPYRYRFTRRDDLLPFFEPPPGGHHVTWHSVIWDEAAQTAAVEYTYEGHHRYHGAAIARIGEDGRIALWREWQHLDDELDWQAMLAGPPTDRTPLHAIDHVQLGMPIGGEPAARAFYGGLLGLREVTKPATLAARGGVWFAGRGVAVHLGADAGHRPAAKAHPAFAVDDLARVRDRLSAAGHVVEDDDAGLGIARGYVRDPFGNRIELIDRWDAGFSTGGIAGN